MMSRWAAFVQWVGLSSCWCVMTWIMTDSGGYTLPGRIMLMGLAAGAAAGLITWERRAQRRWMKDNNR